MNTVGSPGCVILLLDESAGMGAVMGEVVSDGKASTKSNAERVATAVNALLKQLSDGPPFDVALIGYQADAAGQVNVGSRWGGALAGREFVPTSELAAAPLRVETRTRKIPAAGGFGVAREEQVPFPVWYAPTLGSKAPQIAAFDYCRKLLEKWQTEAGPSPGLPLVVHISSSSSGDGNPQVAVAKLLELATPSGAPLLLQAHLAAHASVVSSLYPSNYVYLTLGSARDLFRRASVLPPHLVEALKDAKVPVNPGARGLIYNAKISDLTHMLALVKAHVKGWPSKGGAPAAPPPAPRAPAAPGEPAAAPPTAAAAAGTSETPPATQGERAALVVFVLDRSVADPFSGNTQNPCSKLQDQANDLLKQISKAADGELDAAIVSYGLDGGGQVEVRNTFDGPLAGKSIVPQSELAEGAVRIEEFEEQVSNGIGGLVSVNRKKPIYFDVEPTGAAAPAGAFAAAAQIARDWSARHSTARVAPVVLHLTRGAAAPADMEQAAEALKTVQHAAGCVALYHLVATESPHKSLAYPEGDAEIESPELKKLWELSSPLLGRERISAEKPSVTAEARGIVINGKFDLLLNGIKDALAAN